MMMSAEEGGKETVFCFETYSNLLWKEIVFVIKKSSANSRLKVENLLFFEITRKIIQTVKGQKNFNFLLEVSIRLHWINWLECKNLKNRN